MKRYLAVALLLVGVCYADSSTIIPFSGVPSGACAPTKLGLNLSNGDLYSCNNGTWKAVGGGSGTVSSGTLNHLAKYTAATTVGDSLATDDATTLTYSGTGGVAVAGTNGGFDGLEGTGAGLTAAASHDLLYPDSTAHRWKMNNNNGAALQVGGIVAAGTSAMGTSAIGSGACATVVTTAATGTLTTDRIVATPNADPTGVTGYAVSATGSLYVVAYPTADNVNFKVCNNTSGSLTPSALTFNWMVVR